MAKLILSAFADEYAADLDSQLEGLNRLGIRFIELRHIDGKNIADLTAPEVEALREKLDQQGIRVSAIGSPLGKITLDDDFSAHLEKARNVFEAARTLGTNMVRMFSFYPGKGQNIADCREQVFSRLEAMITLAEEYGILLCHENESKIYGETPERCLELLEHFGGRMKCVFDMGNFLLGGYTPYPDAYMLLREYIAYFHIKDALRRGAIVPPGEGKAKIREILAHHCADARQDVFISLEPHLTVFSGLSNLTSETIDTPFVYPDAKSAFTDAANKIKEIISHEVLPN